MNNISQIKDQITELTEKELSRVYDDAEVMMSIIKDSNRPLISRLNQVQAYLQTLQARNITISELKGQITLLGD